MSKVTEDLGKRLGRAPEDPELAEELDMSLDDFRELQLQVSQLGTISLHESVDDDDSGKTFIDNLEDTKQASVQERMEVKVGNINENHLLDIWNNSQKKNAWLSPSFTTKNCRKKRYQRSWNYQKVEFLSYTLKPWVN